MQLRATVFGVFMLAMGSSAYEADLPGKAIFDKTCKECHGEKGKGNLTADKFYQVTIPRLTSKFVQDKSDAELKEIIIKGKRQMKAVRPGQPLMQHHGKSEWVDDVISYVRTLKN